MADENNADSITEAVETEAPAKIPAPKKPRAPRRQKAAAEATAAAPTAETVKSPTGRRKRREKAGETTSTHVETPVADNSKTKRARKSRTVKQTGQVASTSIPAIDEIADLIQLEEENKRLRKTLADKLRAENADLRKRLGLD
jgi:hypothetical protein